MAGDAVVAEKKKSKKPADDNAAGSKASSSSAVAGPSSKTKVKSSTDKKDKDKKDKDKKEKDKKDKKPRPADKKPKPEQKQQPPPRRAPPPPKKKDDDYLAGVDLPPSDDDDDQAMDGPDDAQHPEDVDEAAAAAAEVTARRKADNAARRAADKLKRKEDMAAQQQAAARAEAMRDDQYAIDVSYEGYKDEEASAGVAESQRDIKVRNLTLRVRGRVLLDKTELTIAHGRRYCLVGPNGRGKSTLMRLIGQKRIPVPSGIDVLLVEQEAEGSERSAVQAVVEADEELISLRKEEKDLQGMSQEEQDANALRMTEIFDRLNELGHESAESRAAKILSGLGFTPTMQKRPTNSFSGGWRMRISLARALFVEPTLLLLDEPTNHLDLRAVLWLEEYLMRWKKTLVVVSHDRDFLDNVATDVIHLWNERLHFYKGNFVQFQEMYEQRKAQANKAYERFQKEMKKAGTSKDKKDKVLADVKQQMRNKQQKKKRGEKKEGMDAVEEIEAVDDQPMRWNDYEVKFEFPEPTELPPPLLQIMEGEFSYPGRDDSAMKNIDVGVDMGTRVAVIGPNGAGKSTLMNILAGDLKLTAGEHRRSHKLRIGRYSQHFVDVLSYDVSPVQYLLEAFPDSGMNQHKARALLGRFGLSGENHLKPIVKLSGGQKARVVFSSIYLSNPHILLLDEPTNNLDMESIDALSEAVRGFEGGVVLISHDARLITNMMDDDECRTEIWVVDEGTVSKYPGDFEDYRDELVKAIQAEQDDI